MLNIETKELKISDKLKRKIEMIGRFTNTTPIINNGSIKNIIMKLLKYIAPFKYNLQIYYSIVSFFMYIFSFIKIYF